MYPVKNENYVQQAQELLLYQFRNSPNILKYIEIFHDQIQELELEYFSMLDALGIETAVDYGLDIIGKEVGEPRDGRSDEDYRSAILTRVFINNSSGTPEDVIAAAKQITGATRVNYSAEYPAGIVLEVIGAEYVSKAPTIKKTIPAGVDLIFLKNVELEDTQLYVATAYSFVKCFESNPI